METVVLLIINWQLTAFIPNISIELKAGGKSMKPWLNEGFS